jgi:VWFA-related protein
MRRTLACRLLPLLVAHLCAAWPLGAWSEPDPAVERTRAFFDDGPALLLPAAERERLASLPAPERIGAVAAWLAADPLPETPDNELATAIAHRRLRVHAAGVSFFDDRGKLLFLLGEPAEKTVVDCGDTFRPLEIWTYGTGGEARTVVLYRPKPGAHFRAWQPTDSKRVLYNEEMEYFLEQFEELRGRIRGKRPDLQFCKETQRLDRVTGVEGLFGFKKERMTDAQVAAFFAPPADLAAWARAAAADPPQTAEPLPVGRVTFSFPERRDQRILSRVRLELDDPAVLGVAEEAGGSRETRIAATGRVEQLGAPFEEFRTRFVLPPARPGVPVVLQLERALRPKQSFVLRLELRDEVTGRTAYVDRGLEVPGEPLPEPDTAAAEVVVGQDLGLGRPQGRDSLILLPPLADVVFGLFRAEALVVGERIRKVQFFVDGKGQLTRSAPPWSAELRLPTIPAETVVRAEGYDAEGRVIAADEILLNEPQGEPRVKLLAPPRGRRVSGTVRARAAVVVPSGRRVEQVEFKLNDEVLATLTQPPWEATFEAPQGESVAYLTVAAIFEDGMRVEDYRILNAGDFLEEVEVELVELYATVTDRSGSLVDGLAVSDFTVLDNGKRQTISKFEIVRDLPLTLGLVLDTSGSMRESIGEAKRAAIDFVRAVMTPRDRGFAVGFSDRPALLMPMTPDGAALEIAFRDLPAFGNTALHDALVYSLYQYRGVRGRKAMVLLSDGDDTSSIVPFADALLFAQRSGVAIYTIGLGIGPANLGIRGKLQKLAEETGGRVFYIDKAAELGGAYDQIERELRSQYLLAFAPDPPAREGERRRVEIEMGPSGLKARAARGYTP